MSELSIVEFIEARLRDAKWAAHKLAEVREVLDDQARQIDPQLRDGAEYVFRQGRLDPAYVLADIAAKRQILAEHALVESDDWKAQQKGEWSTPEALQHGCRRCDDEDGYIYGTNGCRTIRLLAPPFASHESYNSDWSLP